MREFRVAVGIQGGKPVTFVGHRIGERRHDLTIFALDAEDEDSAREKALQLYSQLDGPPSPNSGGEEDEQEL